MSEKRSENLIPWLESIARPKKAIDAVTSPAQRKAVKNTITYIESLESQLAAANQALDRFRENTRILQGRIEFANLPIGNCAHCMVGNKPGSHHLPDCPAYVREGLEKLK